MSSEEVGAMYAAVDISKKKKKRSKDKQDDSEITDSNLPMYSVVNKKKPPKSVAPYVPPSERNTPTTGTYEPVDNSNDAMKKEDKEHKPKFKRPFILALVLAVIFGVALVICFIISLAAIVSTSRLMSDITLLQQQQLHEQLLQQQDISLLSLLQQQIENVTQSQRSDEQIQQILITTLSGIFEQYPAISCGSLLPSFPSGYYWVRNSNGSAVRVYCDMTRSCGGVTGGWMRVTELDMTNSSHQCPSGLNERVDGDIRTCGILSSITDGCSSVIYSTANINYSRICGRITAYQVGTTNGFRPFYDSPMTNRLTINSAYVDGVSLTHGSPSARQHIWTFAAALDKTDNSNNEPPNSCPCLTPNNYNPPPFVGNDSFCDAGNEEFINGDSDLQPEPLWDGTECLCCTHPPWFYKQLPQPTTDNIEMRVCRDESNENIAIQVIEIYVN